MRRRIRFKTPRRSKRELSKVIPWLGIFGTVSIGVMSGLATRKVINEIMIEENINDERLTTREKLKIAIPAFIPTVLVCGGTILCIVESSKLSKKQHQSLVNAYGLVSLAFREYRGKVIQIYGAKADRDIQDAIVATNAQFHLINPDVPDEPKPFYEPVTRRTIMMRERDLISAEYHFNRNFILGYGAANFNQWLEFLGIETDPKFDYIGWDPSTGISWVDFQHREVTDELGRKCYVIDYVFDPELMDESYL